MKRIIFLIPHAISLLFILLLQFSQAAEFDSGPDGTSFWEHVPTVVPSDSKRGDILWVQERFDPPAGARAWNIIYVSESIAGPLQYVSGEIYVPDNLPSSPNPVILWNHATVGSQDSCAPSRNNLLGYQGNPELPRIPAINTLIAKGYVVVASDYQGLGTPGGSAYLNGPGQAKASLDVLKAAANFSYANIGNRFATYGYSQGGQSSLWIAHLANDYAPKFELLGAVSIAGASRHLDLSFVDIEIAANSGYFITRMAGLQVGNPHLRLTDILTPAGLEQLTYLSYGCFDLWAKASVMTEEFAKPEALKPGHPWRILLEENDAFLPINPSLPLLILHGDEDVDVPIAVTHNLISDICEQNGTIEYYEFPDTGHRGSVPLAAEIIPEWFDARFDNQPIENNHCNE